MYRERRCAAPARKQERDSYPEFGISFPKPDFAAYARSCGGEGFRIEDPRDLDGALQAAFGSGKPSVVDILIDPGRVSPATKRAD